MADEHYDFRPVRGGIVRPKKPGAKPYWRKGHHRLVKVKAGQAPKSKAKKLQSVTSNLLEEGGVGAYAEELAPLLRSIDRILNEGGNNLKGWQPNPRYGLARRITIQPTSAYDEIVVVPFRGENQAIVLGETQYLQTQTPDHVITSTWGTVDDWKEAGREIRLEELECGLELQEDEHIPAGTVVYHETQTVGYRPAPTPEVTGRTPTTDAVMEARITKTEVECKPWFVSAYWAGTDSMTLIPEGHAPNHEAHIHNYLHELAHATGHPSRLGRQLAKDILESQETRVVKPDRQEINNHEEVVAEMAATIAARKLIEHYGAVHGAPKEYSFIYVDRSAAYIFAHLPRNKREAREVLRSAIPEAEQAADWILSRALPT